MPGTNGASGVKAARPKIAVAGQDNKSLADGLLGLLVVETTAGLYRCEARLGNWGNASSNSIGFLYFDRALLDFGKAFQVKLDADTIFDGRIMGLEAHFLPDGDRSEITVLAEDRFQDLRMTRRTRTFDNLADADVFRQVASDHGLTPDVSVSGPSHRLLAQVNQSDLAFLRDRARSIDAELWVDGRTLHVSSRANRAGATVQLTRGRELREFSVLADLARQYTSVAVAGWDVAGKSAVRHDATDSILSGELGGGDGGASILASAVGQRKEALAHTVPLVAAEAQAEAEAFFKLSARRFVVGSGLAEGDGRLRVGTYVDLKGLGPLFSGKYYLSEVRHTFDGRRGAKTEFVGERPWLGKPQ